MIVVDTNVIAYLLLPGERNPEAIWLRETDREWAAPLLWRSEFRNILATRMRRKLVTYEQASAVAKEAEALLADREHMVASPAVIELVRHSDCTAYDCEFVALALQLEVQLVTADKQVLRAFPGIAVPFS